ncbi:MAG: sugar transferase [Ruminococcaceae bacterium]|nr:sugar transferase [Oscillospiraceae bacterium]
MIKTFIKIRKSVMLAIKALMLCAITFIFIEAWITHYTNSLFSKNGNYLVIFSFVFLLILFGALFSAFKIGIYRLSEIIYSLSLSIVITNFMMYLELSLIAREMLNPAQLLLSMCFEIGIGFIGSVCANTVYFKLYPPKELLAIFGDDQAGFRLITRMNLIHQRFKIMRGVNANTESLEKIKQLIDKYEGVLICDIDKNLENKLYSYCYSKQKRIYLLPSVTDILISKSHQIQIGDTVVIMGKNLGLSPEQRFLKRALDIVVSGILLIVASPFMIVTALAIKLYDGGSVLYKQERLTLNGKHFYVYKFRSMIENAEQKSGAVLASKSDSRITPVGKIIRACRLDELPQLINVLKGDMSLVGPRPERPEIAEQYYETLPEFAYRLKTKAGLTGYAQLYGKYNTTPADKLKMDLIYIESYSIWLDFKLLILTFKILFMKDSTEGVDQNKKTAEK